MTSIILTCIILSCWVSTGMASSVLDGYNDALARSVNGNRVDYKVLCQEKGFNDFIKSLADGSFVKPNNAADQLAYWLNIYNAYNAKIVCDHYPITNLNQLHKGGLVIAALRGKTVWDQVVVVAGKQFTLKGIEHKIIKKEFQQPLSQFGLACGSVFCPALREVAYEGKIINDQLADQARRFFADQSLNRFDRLSKTATISPIMNWNAKYFGSTTQKVLVFIAEYLPDEVKSDVATYPDQWRVRYTPYDLIVNDISVGKKD